MDLEEKIYSVLIVSAADAFNNAARELLPVSDYQPVIFSSNISEAKRLFTERSFDFVIVNSPLPNDNGTRFAIDCCHSLSTSVLLFARGDVHEEIAHKVVPHGVFTLPKPTSKQLMATSFSWLKSSRERLRKLEKKTLSVEERMEEIRIINRAKLLLVSERHMTEAEAHRYIERHAMDSCSSKRKIAEQIIAET